MLAVCPAVPWKHWHRGRWGWVGQSYEQLERRMFWVAYLDSWCFFFSQTILLWWSPCQWNFKKGKYMRSWWIKWVLDRREVEDYMYMTLIKWTFCIQVFQITKYETPIGACLWINNILKLSHGINICKSLRLLKFQSFVSVEILKVEISEALFY